MTARRPRVAIDGAAGAGKSTLGRALARALGVPFLNTGAMYRSLAARALSAGADLEDGEALAALARSVEFAMDAKGDPPGLLIDGRPPGDHLSSPAVERSVSLVARHPAVRRVMAAEQRRLAGGGGVVEGRDIGTVVLPDADVKIFLRASERERAARRVAEREGPAGELASALARRDALDAKVNPLVAAPDAVEIDTEGRDQRAVLDEALGVVSAALARED
ncbi:MAG TPA: (d)CMP kinase [Actinomycetota bacterium]|nr:(d)CMP kinase [Actinomycetota bacterium]